MHVQYPTMVLAARVSQHAVDPQWSARCAWRLRQRWPHADPLSLEEAAEELWANPELQALDPVVAADRWLEPVNAPSDFDVSLELTRFR